MATTNEVNQYQTVQCSEVNDFVQEYKEFSQLI